YRQHSDIAFSAILDVKLTKVRPLCADRDPCQIETVGHDWSDCSHAALKISKRCPSPTIPGDLVVVITGEPERKRLREMLHQRPLKMKLGGCRVVGVGIFTVKGEAYGGGQLQANLGVEPCHRAGYVERPTVDRDVGNAAVAPWSNRDVQKGIEVPMPVALVPTDQGIQRRIAKVGRVLIEIEMPAC